MNFHLWFSVGLIWAFAMVVQQGSPVHVDTDDDGKPHGFCYYGKETAKCGPRTPAWDGECPTGTKQSPINIPYSGDNEKAIPVELALNPEYKQVYSSFFIKNNGHSVQVSLNEDPTSSAEASGSMLKGNTYVFAQLHFHWGSFNGRGSEHLLNRRPFPMELHLVHYKKKFNDLGAAASSKEAGALAVIGIFFDFDEENTANDALQPIVEQLKGLTTDESVPVNDFELDITKFFPKDKTAFRYDGSLTTPSCAEVVLWNVFADTITVSQDQMNAFRGLMVPDDMEPLVDNYRPVQALNGRTIELLAATVTDADQ